jgi:hypothetical protein
LASQCDSNFILKEFNVDNELDLTRRCLVLISRIAARAAASPDADHVSDTLMELAIALERPKGLQTGHSGDQHPARSLDRIHQELNFIDSTSQEFTARDALKFALRSTWN